ncbi:MAG: hypothetical protein RR521_11320 [Clostridia bacterium]
MKLKTIRDAAETLHVSEGRLRRAAMAGEVPTMKLGNRALVDVDAARLVLSEPEGVPIEAVSEQTGLSVSAIRRAMREGWMPHTKPGRAYIFDLESVQAAIERRMNAQQRNKK